MATRLYLHHATSTVGGTLPSSEQSSKTSYYNFESQSTNRSMDTGIGTLQTSRYRIMTAATNADRTCYVTRFISDPLGAAGISANTWRFNFASRHSNLSVVDDYPTYDNNHNVPITCYVWRPSTGAKVGNIFDGDACCYIDQGAYQDPPGTTLEKSQDGTFSGSAVSGAAVGDVIVLEVWTNVWTSSSSTAYLYFYYDGGTTTLSDNVSVSDHASFLETPETLAFTAPVSNTTIHKYDIYEYIPQTSIQKYNISSYVPQTSIQKYHILNPVSQTNIEKYHILNPVSQTSIHKYNIGGVYQTSIQKYDIINDVIQNTIQKYDILNTVMQSSTQKYDILNNAIQTAIHKYNIINNAIQTTIHKYNIIELPPIDMSITSSTIFSGRFVTKV